MLKAVLFDLDGTLIDSEQYYKQGTYNWIKNKGIDINIEELHAIIGLSLHDTYAKVSELTGLSVEEVKEANEHYFNVEEPLNFNKWLFKETKEVFFYVKEKGYKIAICSMSPAWYIKQFGEETGLSAYIDYYISGGDCKHNKPYPDIYLKALSDMGLEKDEVIVIEDAPSGILAAKNAGLKVYARDASKFKLDQSKADGMLSDLKDLYKII